MLPGEAAFERGLLELVRGLRLGRVSELCALCGRVVRGGGAGRSGEGVAVVWASLAGGGCGRGGGGGGALVREFAVEFWLRALVLAALLARLGRVVRVEWEVSELFEFGAEFLWEGGGAFASCVVVV